MLSSQNTALTHRLVRRDALTLKEWLVIIEERRALMQPHLRDMNLRTIGKLPAVSYMRGTRVLESHNPIVEGDFDLSMKCAFPEGGGLYSGTIPSKLDHIYDPPGSSPAAGVRERFWGLARSGDFVVIEALVWFERLYGRDEKITVEKVSVRKCPLPELFPYMKVEPEKVWLQLGRVVKDWHKARESLLWDSAKLAKTVKAEEGIYALAFSR
jgi:hypothetical protein